MRRQLAFPNDKMEIIQMDTTPAGLTELDSYLESSHNCKTSMHNSSARNTPVTEQKVTEVILFPSCLCHKKI